MGRASALILCAVVPVVAIVCVLLVAARAVERSDRTLSLSGFQFLLSGINRTVELNLRLGLPLSELQQADTILENAVGSAPDVLAADIIGPTGVTLFSTDRGAVGEPVPRAWSEAMRTGRDTWQARERETVTLGQVIVNDFEQDEGWVAIIVDASRLAPPLSRTPDLFARALPILAAVIVVGVVLAMVVFWGSGRRTEAVAARVRSRAVLDGCHTRLDTAADRAIAGLVASETLAEDVQRDLRRLDAEL